MKTDDFLDGKDTLLWVALFFFVRWKCIDSEDTFLCVDFRLFFVSVVYLFVLFILFFVPFDHIPAHFRHVGQFDHCWH